MDLVVLGEERGGGKGMWGKGMEEGTNCLALPENPENCLAKRLGVASVGQGALGTGSRLDHSLMPDTSSDKVHFFISYTGVWTKAGRSGSRGS